MNQSVHKIYNSELRIKTASYGARLVNLELNKSGTWVSLCAGFDDISRYQLPAFQYFGATVGRVAGRLPGGRYGLDGLDLQLEQNENGNHLHGGGQGAIHNRDWELRSSSDSHIIYSLLSRNGAGGFPGNLRIESEYRIDGTNLIMTMRASTDSKTPVNLTNHAYWNLSGNSASAADHELQIFADTYIPVGQDLLPAGPEVTVAGTPMDFREMKVVGVLGTFSQEPTPGYDHTYLLRKGDGIRPAATLHHPESGISMSIETDSDVLQFYSGNRNPVDTGSQGMAIKPGNTVCLEAFGVNSPEVVGNYKTITLNPGEEFSRTVVHRFSY